MLGLKKRPGIGDGTAVSPGIPGPSVVDREDAWKAFAPGKPCVPQSLGTGWPGMLWSLQSPWLLRSCLLPVLFMAQAAASLGCFQRVGRDALCSEGLTAQGQGIAEGIGRSRGSRVCPSCLDLPLAKVEGFKEAQGDDLVNGCMTQLLPCGVGCFVSLISLFMPVGNLWAWEVAAGVSFAQLHLC